jgi:hypothetical protein
MSPKRADDPVSEFIGQLKQGQNPSVDEFAARYPGYGPDLRDELEGARVLFWGSVVPRVAEQRVRDVAAAIERMREAESSHQQLAERLLAAITAAPTNLPRLALWHTDQMGLTPCAAGAGGPASARVSFRGGRGDATPLEGEARGLARLRRVHDAATDLLRRALIETPPVDLADVSDVARAIVANHALDGYEGCTFHFEEGAVIYLDPTSGTGPRYRFTWAHELGHAVLHPRPNPWADSGPTLDDEWDARDPTQEAEANRFAAELLMPEDLLEADRVPQAQPGLEAITRLAHTYDVSLTAAASRFVGVSDSSVAVCFVERGETKWCAKSRYFEAPLRRGEVHPHSAVAGVEAGENEYERHVSLTSWSQIDTDAELYEIGQRVGRDSWLVLLLGD